VAAGGAAIEEEEAYSPVGVHQDVREMKEGEPVGGTPPPDEAVTAEEAAAHDAD
jgi:hypothetical protein